jgi:hypothetical protein
MSEKAYAAPSRAVTDAAHDQAHLRSLVYELARVGLQRDLHRRYELELQKQSAALENAIIQIESHFSSDSAARALAAPAVSDTSITELPDIAVVANNGPSGDYLVEPQPQFEVLLPIGNRGYSDRRWLSAERQIEDSAEPHQRTERRGGWIWWRFQIAAAVIAGLAIYGAGEWFGNVHGLISQDARYQTQSKTGTGTSVNKGPGSIAEPARVPQTIDGAPLPTSYGVYAIDRGKLSDLQPLPIMAPDPRIAISAIIVSPSQTLLADGHVEFVVFRRDLINDAPDRVSVRVVAQVMRALTFGRNKQAKLTIVHGAWAVRSNAYEMKVAPISGHPEMVRISPASAGAVFPAGRYALIFKRLAYDFSVEGPITDLAQCLERTDAVGTVVYSECRKL